MSIDRIVTWKDKKPATDDIFNITNDYFNFGNEAITRSHGWICISIPGKPSFPFKNVTDLTHHFDQEERWIEIFTFEDHCSVVTRGMDELTNTLATGLAKAIRRFYEASYDDGHEKIS